MEKLIILFLFVVLGLLFVVLSYLFLRFLDHRKKESNGTSPSPGTTQKAETIPTSVSSVPLATELLETIPSMPAIGDDTEATLPRTGMREPETVPASGQRPANIGWRIAGLTDVGLKRELNEDSFLMLETEISTTPCGLYVVADGMGGHMGGEVASQLTIAATQDQFTQHPPLPTDAPFAEWLKAAAMAANQNVLANQQNRTQERKMGSTLVMALVMDGQAHIANVGDSRAYHLQPTGIAQITVDHSLVERLVQIGTLTREEARTHKQKNVIYNTIGDKPKLEVSLYHVSLQVGDRLLLCSDGLSGMLLDEEIFAISCAHASPAPACKALVEAAKVAGGDDNISVILVQMDANS